jgi:ribosomal-protein-alanine N-acetyltransferase
VSAREAARVHLRKAGESDIGRLMEIEQSWSHLSHWSTESYRRLIVEDDFAVTFAAETLDEGGGPRIVGFAIVNIVSGAAEIYNIAVDRTHRGTGVGGRLIRAAFAECLRRNAQTVSLEVRKSNRSAIAFYRRFEFRVVGERTSYYSNPVEDALVMERTLVPAGAGA